MAALFAPSPVLPTEVNPPLQIRSTLAAFMFWFKSKPILALVACALVITGIAILWTFSLTEARANAFVDTAVASHRRQEAGHLPLQATATSPKEISAWFEGKVPFHFRLPDSQSVAGRQQRYELRAGSLVKFKHNYAAYIAYCMKVQRISLLVTSASNSLASGGEETVSGRLTFHTHRRGELQVVTWSTHTLTYALVSGVTLPAGQSCIVCHASSKDRRVAQDFSNLRNRPG